MLLFVAFRGRSVIWGAVLCPSSGDRRGEGAAGGGREGGREGTPAAELQQGGLWRPRTRAQEKPGRTWGQLRGPLRVVTQGLLLGSDSDRWLT